MSKFYQTIEPKFKTFIERQHIFFTATADADGRINCSPKGMDSFRVLSDRQVGFLSVTGSGNETAAHLKKDGRITLMFCSFEKQPLILRIYGHGRCIYTDDPEWSQVARDFQVLSGARQIFIIDVDSVQTSCGYSIPFFAYEGERDALIKWADGKGPDGIRQYWKDRNLHSIDGLDTGLTA